jgi:hypothetical protein
MLVEIARRQKWWMIHQTKYKLLLVTKTFPKYYVGNGGCASEIFICRIN